MTTNLIKEFYCGKKVLITGGAGYLSSNVSYILKDIDCYILRFDIGNNFPAFNKIKAEISDIVGDIKDVNALEKLLIDVDVVFHFAAQTSVYVSNENPISDFNINVLPMLLILEVCRKNGHRPIIIFAGTATEAGIQDVLPVNEFHLDNPTTLYDLHKLMAENYLKYYAKQGSINGTVLRLSNVYGPGPRSSSADRGILNKMIQKALSGQNLTIYGNGEYIRDYVYVKDIANAFLLAAANSGAVNGQHFVIGSGVGTKLIDAFTMVAKLVFKKTGKKVDIIKIEPPENLSPIEKRNFIADSGNFRRLTGWTTDYSIEKGLQETINSFCNLNL